MQGQFWTTTGQPHGQQGNFYNLDEYGPQVVAAIELYHGSTVHSNRDVKKKKKEEKKKKLISDTAQHP